MATKEEKGSMSSSGDVRTGNGGELHQVAGADHPVLTTNQGNSVSDNQNSLRANAKGPTLLEDLFSVKRSPISITSAFRSVSFMRVAQRCMAFLS